MALFGGLWDAAVVIFLVLVFAEYMKVRTKATKQFNWIAGSGLLVLLAAASSWISVAGNSVVSGATTLFGVIAWIMLLIGALWGALELTKAK
ncbi:MAG: hypothetical protein HY369_02620 [Candidatus Aenigmarchaeota archaeon]|nr:hypothetical protein [Candidatus Aenigmarchaeota archaeon]